MTSSFLDGSCAKQITFLQFAAEAYLNDEADLGERRAAENTRNDRTRRIN